MISINITVCIGSGCHVKGSRNIINLLKEYIQSKDEMSINLDLQACFCQERCTEGVVVKFNEEIITNVSKDNVLNILNDKIKKEG